MDLNGYSIYKMKGISFKGENDDAQNDEIIYPLKLSFFAGKELKSELMKYSNNSAEYFDTLGADYFIIQNKSCGLKINYTINLINQYPCFERFHKNFIEGSYFIITNKDLPKELKENYELLPKEKINLDALAQSPKEGLDSLLNDFSKILTE